MSTMWYVSMVVMNTWSFCCNLRTWTANDTVLCSFIGPAMLMDILKHAVTVQDGAKI